MSRPPASNSAAHPAAPATQTPTKADFRAPETAEWLRRHATEPAADRRALRLRHAVAEHDLARAVAVGGREDFLCLARRGLQPSDAVVASARALLGGLAPRGILCDEEGDAAREALAVAAAELVERGQSNSLLVVCAASDRAAWRELLARFGVNAGECEDDRIARLAEGCAWILDHATAAARARQLHDRRFGIVLLDEAQALGRETVRALRAPLGEECFVFARTSAPLADGFATLHALLDLVRGVEAHPLGPWDEFVHVFLGGDASARFPRKGSEDELRARLGAWMRRTASAAGAAEAARPRVTAKEHLLEPQPREREFLELAWRAALGFAPPAREHYLVAALGGPWAFAETVERTIAGDTTGEPALRRVLQDLVVRGRSVRETAKTAQVAQLARKVQKDKDARVLVSVRSAATANSLAHALAQAGFLDQVDVLKEGQDGLSRMALRRFALGERRILIAPDGAAKGTQARGATDHIHFDQEISPSERAERMARIAPEDAARVSVHRLVLGGTPELAVHTLQQRAGFLELGPDQGGAWLADLGLDEAGWRSFQIARAAEAAEGTASDEAVLPLLEQRKRSRARRDELRRAADRVLGELARKPAPAPEFERAAPRHSAAQLVAASLELRSGGWKLTDDKRILLEHAGRLRELRVPERPGRTLPHPPAEDAAVLPCEPGSWAWNRLTADFRAGSAYLLGDARGYPLDRIRRRIVALMEPHGLIVESLAIVAAEPAAALRLALRAQAQAGPERHEAWIEVGAGAGDHGLDAYVDAPETLPYPDGSTIPTLERLDGPAAEAVARACEQAAGQIERQTREVPAFDAFLAAHAASADPLRPAAEPFLAAELEGVLGVVYELATVEVLVRHRDQGSARPLRMRCVPAAGVVLDGLPAPEGVAPDAALWVCAAGHLVAAGAVAGCATPGCTTGLCAEHAGADDGLRACADCGSARCAEHASACAGCGRVSCAEHLEQLDSGSLACAECAETLEDGRRFLRREIAWSAVSRGAGPKCEMERSALSGRWAFAYELVACEVSGRRLLPDEVATCARSDKRVARDLLFQDPISGLYCRDEYFVPSCVSGTRALPESMERSAASGRFALPHELKTCAVCAARLLPEEGAECPETGAFACGRHLRRCAESDAPTLPEGLGRCEVSGAEVRHSLLAICPETGKRARRCYFVPCASSGVEVLPQALETCAATGVKVRRSLLQTCAVTGQRVKPEHLGTCSVTGKRVVIDLLVTCADGGAKLLKEEAEVCEESGAVCAPDALETCAATGRRARRSLLGVDELSGQRVLLRLLRECVRTGKRTQADRLESCAVSRALVLPSELVACQETGRRALPDRLERCAATGALVHPDQLVACAASKRRILRRVAETCEISGELVAPGALETCTITGKRVLPSLLGLNEVTGSKVLRDLLVSCERTGRKTLRENLVRSAVSGVEITEDVVVHCEASGAPALAEELATCAATGKRVLPSLLGTCQVSGDRVLDEYLQPCEATGKRVRPDLLQTCSRTGKRVLPQQIGVSRISGDRGLKDMLVTCETTRRQAFPDELVLSERSGKRIGRDRAVTCAVSGRVVDLGETGICTVCRQSACEDEVFEGVCGACLDLVGRSQGVPPQEEAAAALRAECGWARSPSSNLHGDVLRAVVRRGALGSLASPWLLVLRRDAAAGGWRVVQQERLSADARRTLRRLVREQSRLHREQERAAKGAE